MGHVIVSTGVWGEYVCHAEVTPEVGDEHSRVLEGKLRADLVAEGLEDALNRSADPALRFAIGELLTRRSGRLEVVALARLLDTLGVKP